MWIYFNQCKKIIMRRVCIIYIIYINRDTNADITNPYKTTKLTSKLHLYVSDYHRQLLKLKTYIQ